MRHTYYVAVLVIRPAGDRYQLLLLCRAAGRYMGGTWQLVTGGLKTDEVAWRGALREVKEETGLVPREFYRLSAMTSFYRSDNDTLNTAPMFCAIVDAGADVILDDESTSFRWVDVEQAATHLMWPSDRQAIEEVTAVVLGGGAAKPYLRIEI